MYLSRAFQQFLVALAVLPIAQGGWLDTSKFRAKGLLERQVGDVLADVLGGSASSSSAKAESQSTPTPESTTSVSSITTTTSQLASPTSASTPVTPATTSSSSAPPLATTEATTSVISSAHSIVETTSNSIQYSTSSSFHWTPLTTSSSSPARATPVVSTKVEILTSTLSDGSMATVTSVTKTTTTPVLNSGDGETSGMSTKTRNTVIGVVVGVGGAIVLGALALVAWRIWGRRKHNEEHDILMDYDMSAPGMPEKTERGSSAGGTQQTPFQSTLENYHQPNQVNASANF